MEHLAAALPKLSYQLFFNKNTPEAIAELDKDVRRTIRATLRTVASPPPDEFLKSRSTFVGGWDNVAEVELQKTFVELY
jgi:soluble epoxide hydrolase/lipid-phosphate phosphatase